MNLNLRRSKRGSRFTSKLCFPVMIPHLVTLLQNTRCILQKKALRRACNSTGVSYEAPARSFAPGWAIIYLCSHFLKLCFDGIGAIRQFYRCIVIEENGVGLAQAQEHAQRQLPYLNFRVRTGAHLDEMTPGAGICGSDNRCLGFIG